MSTEIYYFSGTGNSLHVAKELQKRIPEAKVIPMVSLLNQAVIKTNAAIVGLVFPVYVMTVPVPVKKFLKKLDLKSAAYIFAISTSMGFPGLVDINIEKILKKKGKRLDAYFTLKMAGNSPTGLRPTSDKDWVNQITGEKIAKLESTIQNSFDSIQEVIINQERTSEKFKSHPIKNLLKHFLSLLMAPIEAIIGNTKLPFFADSNCTGCGMCEKVCLSKKIKTINDKPIWQKEIQCYFCYACFNFCPEQAILVRDYAEKTGRYHYPEITAEDIAGQK